ncbi:MAG: M20 family metallopeptidase [Deinococcales bacterium]
MQQPLLDQAKSLLPQIRQHRRYLHQYPELSFQEVNTANYIASQLQRLGIPYQQGIAKTGLVATIQGNSSTSLGLRADMDALPIQEANGTEFDSKHGGIMHACGHDAHTSMLLGAAEILQAKAQRGELAGTVRLLFQPSEEDWDAEGKSGGRRMVEEGALEGLSAVFGLHVDSSFYTGQLANRSGPLLAAVDDFELTLIGKGGHAASPHQTSDVIALGALVINAVHQIVSRRLDPIEQGVISISTIHGGRATNVIDEKLQMSGTIRSFSPQVRAILHKELANAAALVRALGAEYQLKIIEGYPATINNPEASSVVESSFKRLIGEAFKEAPMSLGSEDFSFMAKSVPGCFWLLGVRHPSWQEEYPVHTPTFRLDEEALALGTASLCTAAEAWFTHLS